MGMLLLYSIYFSDSTDLCIVYVSDFQLGDDDGTDGTRTEKQLFLSAGGYFFTHVGIHSTWKKRGNGTRSVMENSRARVCATWVLR